MIDANEDEADHLVGRIVTREMKMPTLPAAAIEIVSAKIDTEVVETGEIENGIAIVVPGEMVAVMMLVGLLDATATCSRIGAVIDGTVTESSETETMTSLHKIDEAAVLHPHLRSGNLHRTLPMLFLS